LLHDIGFLVIT